MDGDLLFYLAILMATGIIKARAPMLFINAELRVTATTSAVICTIIVSHSLRRCLAIKSTTPAFMSPLLTTRTAATVMTAG